MPLALLSRRPGKLSYLGHIESDLFLNDFKQRNVRGPQIARIGHQGTAHRARTGVKLPDPARNKVDQNVWITDFFQCFSSEFGVQRRFQGNKRAA